jgi:hypothetical protein
VRLALVVLTSCLGLNPAARAADIKASPITGLQDTALITVSGAFENSDAEQFRSAMR